MSLEVTALARLEGAVIASGLISGAGSGVVLVSGGPDSACALAGVRKVVPADRLTALHVDYGLRPESADAARAAEALCERLGVELVLERPALPGGNLQEQARDARYGLAERLRADRGLDWIATGHTRTDRVETMLFRLARSPGRRALLGMPARRERVVRPLIALTREETRQLASEAGLPFVDDPSNVEPAFARNRIRNEVLPVLRDLNPQIEGTVAETWEELAAESEALTEFAVQALEGAEVAGAVPAATLAALHPAIARLALERLAERSAARPTPVRLAQAAEVARLAATPEGGSVDLGGGVSAICEHGMVRIRSGAEGEPEPSSLSVPGSARFGPWRLDASIVAAPVKPEGPDVATLDAALLAATLEVRAWQDGDRLRPLGLKGSKSLQDLFGDAKVPRSLRRRLPVVISDGVLAWVPGVAVAEQFRLTAETTRVAVLRARSV